MNDHTNRIVTQQYGNAIAEAQGDAVLATKGNAFLITLEGLAFEPQDRALGTCGVVVTRDERGLWISVHRRLFMAVLEHVLVGNRLTGSVSFFEVLRDQAISPEPIQRVLYDSLGNYRLPGGVGNALKDIFPIFVKRFVEVVHASLPVVLDEK